MAMKARSRVCDAWFADLKNWPDFDISGYDRATQALFGVVKSCARKYLGGMTAAKAVENTKLNARLLQKIVKKALSQDPARNEIFGFRAFIPYKAQSPRVRNLDLADSAAGGTTLSLTYVFQRFPDIERDLKEFLLSKTRPNCVSNKVLHAEFKRLCRKEGLGDEDYPFNTQAKGKNAIVQWYRTKFIPLHWDEHVAAEYGEEAQAANEFANGDGESEAPPPLFAYWVLDAANLDLNAQVALPDQQGVMEDMAVRRGTVLRLIAKNPTTNLSWRLILAPKPCGEDIAILLWDALNGMALPDATVPDVEYMPGASFPALADPRFRFALPLRVYLDNALEHLKDEIQNIISLLWGGEVKLGRPKSPRERAEIESAMSKQARRVIHQAPGTTGSGHKDHKRNRAKVPLKNRVKLPDLLHVLDAYIRNENAVAAESAMYRPPLARLIKAADQELIDFNWLDEERREPFWFSDPQERSVCVDAKKKRAHYVNYKYARYSSDKLKRLSVRKVIVRADPNNLQFAVAWHTDGTLIGKLKAHGFWGDYPNDIRIRRLFGEMKKVAGYADAAEDKPLYALFKYLRDGAKTSERQALKLAYLVDFFSRHVSEEQLEVWKQGRVADVDAEAVNDSVMDGCSALEAGGSQVPIEGPQRQPAATSNSTAPPSSVPKTAPRAPVSPAGPKRAFHFAIPRRLRA